MAKGGATLGFLGAHGVATLPSRKKVVKENIIKPNPLSNSESK
jgi:hypothetical protein